MPAFISAPMVSSWWHPFVIPLMTARNDPRRAVLFGEVGNRQHELQASLATILRMPPERSGIVAMG